MSENSKSLIIGCGEVFAGMTIVNAGLMVREIVSQNGIPNWDAYHNLVSHMGKLPVDGLISWGNDLGGVLMFMSIGEILKSGFSGEVRDIVEDICNFSLLGIVGAIAAIGEMYDIGVSLINQKCSLLGCGDPVDLLIFAGAVAYPFVRRKMRERNNLSKQ